MIFLFFYIKTSHQFFLILFNYFKACNRGPHGEKAAQFEGRATI